MAQREGTKLIPCSFEVEKDLRDEIKRHAKENDRSFSAEVRRTLRISYFPGGLGERESAA
jgi:hypothetical protein